MKKKRLFCAILATLLAMPYAFAGEVEYGSGDYEMSKEEAWDAFISDYPDLNLDIDDYSYKNGTFVYDPQSRTAVQVDASLLLKAGDLLEMIIGEIDDLDELIAEYIELGALPEGTTADSPLTNQMLADFVTQIYANNGFTIETDMLLFLQTCGVIPKTENGMTYPNSYILIESFNASAIPQLPSSVTTYYEMDTTELSKLNIGGTVLCLDEGGYALGELAVLEGAVAITFDSLADATSPSEALTDAGSTLTLGNADSATFDGNLVNNATLAITNNATFSFNASQDKTLDNTAIDAIDGGFQSNTSTATDGAIFNTVNATLDSGGTLGGIANSFQGNTATGGADGAIFNTDDTSYNLSDIIGAFQGNTATGTDGAINTAGDTFSNFSEYQEYLIDATNNAVLSQIDSNSMTINEYKQEISGTSFLSTTENSYAILGDAVMMNLVAASGEVEASSAIFTWRNGYASRYNVA